MSENPFTSPQDAGPAGAPAQFKDRRTGLILMGIFEILLGLLAVFMALFMVVTLFLPQPAGQAMDARMIVPGALMYVLGAVLFVWLGVGSVLARRWARALMLVLSWMWLVVGLLTMIWMVVFMPSMHQQIAADAHMPPEALVAMQAVMMGSLGCFYVLLPGVFVLFYQSRHVKATCEARDPKVRWTDKCPLPVLAVSLMLGLGACSMLGMPMYGFLVPFFGRFLRGIPGAGLCLVMLPVLVYLAWATYKLKVHAWWGTVALMILGSASAIVTFLRVPLMEVYEGMGFPEQQLQLLRTVTELQQPLFPWLMAVYAVLALGYLLYIRRYFVLTR